MKVLLVSHNVLSETNNMGKSFLGYLASFSPGEVGQFYIHSEVPTVAKVCTDYYRFTDKDAIKSLFRIKKYGTVFGAKDIDTNRKDARIDDNAFKVLYSKGQKRTGAIYIARNILWRLAYWKTRELKSWLKEFNPDVILFASGDYSFMYRIATWMADYLKKPLVVSCVDDFYTFNRNGKSILGKVYQKFFMSEVHKTMKKTERILTICESMKKEYGALFNKQCEVLYTSAPKIELELDVESKQISYIGNLINNRYLGLVSLGKACKELGYHIDVYSGETDPEIIKHMNEENGICFHGSIPAEQVLDVMRKSMLVIHVESFDEKNKNLVKYSVSTKIAESLMNGPCLLAFGPKGIASIDYLQENSAAYVITDSEKMKESLERIINNPELRQKTVENARLVANKNHNAEINPYKVREWLSDVVNQNSRRV